MARLRNLTHRYGRVTLATLGGILTSIGIFMIVVSAASVSRVARADDCQIVQGTECPLGYHWVEGNCSTAQCIENCCSFCCADAEEPPEESCDQGTCDTPVAYPGEEEEENQQRTCSSYTMQWYTFYDPHWRCDIPNERRDLHYKAGGTQGCQNCECWVIQTDEHENGDPCPCSEEESQGD